MFNKKTLSIDIGSSNIKLVEGKYEGDKVVISKAITVDTPAESFSDGKFTNMITMKKYLEKVFRKQDIRAKKVTFTSKDTSVISRILEVPHIKGEEMDSMIRYEIQQYLPLDFDEYIINYRHLEDFYKAEAKMSRVSVAVYPKTMAKGYWDLAKELRLIPEALDLSSNAIAKLFTSRKDVQINSKDYNKDSTIVVIDLGYNQIELSIISRGILEFTRILMSGAKHLENQEVAITEDSNIHVMDRWNTDIIRMLEYFRNKHKDRNISKIYIYGGASKLKGLTEYMQKVIAIPVERIMNISNIKLEASANNIEIDDYLNAVGAIIRLK